MGANNKDGQYEIRPLPIVGNYDVQRFLQFSPEDSANWYVVTGKNTKRPTAMYPTMGRRHIDLLGFNQLIFDAEPRAIFKSIKYAYVWVGNAVFRVDNQFNSVNISGDKVVTFAGPVYFAFLVINTIVFSCFVDGQKIYIYREDTDDFEIVTDPNAPGNIIVNDKPTKPGFIAAFGNRITVSVAGSSQFFLSVINLLNTAGNFDPATCFTIEGGAVFAQENGIIKQMGVLQNQLYIFTDYTTGIWANIPATFTGTGVTFPWKKNASYDWNFGIANPSSLDIDFGMIAFLAQNSDGLLQFMVSEGGKPERISTKAIDTLLQNYTNTFGGNNPFLSINSNGFLFLYENTIFYRMSGGPYNDDGLLDQEAAANSIEYNFEIKDWHRCIELNGERNRVQYHVFFTFKHLVSIVGEGTIYDMSGQYYFNERRNPDQESPQAPDSYVQDPFRYERTTPIIAEEDYSEFETEYVEIDFVFGLIDVNTIDLDNPSIELYLSDDGGVSFFPADIREFSRSGVYIWKMRWYQLGQSRNRVYKLICVSKFPMAVLGGTMNVRRSSGGSN